MYAKVKGKILRELRNDDKLRVMGQAMKAGCTSRKECSRRAKAKGEVKFSARTELLGRLGATANMAAGAGFNSPEKVAILADFGNRVLRHFGLSIFRTRAGANKGNQLPRWVLEAITESNAHGAKVGMLLSEHFERLSQFPFGVINTPMELI